MCADQKVCDHGARHVGSVARARLPNMWAVTTLGGQAGRSIRALVVLLCVFGAAAGFAGGTHAAGHTPVGAAQPGHHHHGSSGDASQTGEELAATRARRRVDVGVTTMLPARVVAHSLRIRRLTQRRISTLVPRDAWPTRAAVASSPTRLGICRT